ncbi:MAG TPA: N-acetylmuramoyl-L-alanine amidase [Mucilaginibacter sp.]|nr:N-acetylmuramoyl-L-alanine amidase [Mucilaginibacter sp.]
MTCRFLLSQKPYTVFLCLAFVLLCGDVFGQVKKKHHRAAKPAESSQSAPKFRFRTVIIDAGHGGKDPGAHGAYSKEKNITLAIAKKLRTALTEQMPSLNVVMTRTTDNFVELHRRDEIASENKGNLFISIHCNASPERVSSERGVLLLVYGFHRNGEQLEAIRENASIYIEKDYRAQYNGYGENSAVNAIVLRAFQQKFRKQCILFADLVNNEFKKEDGRHSLGVKEQGVLVLQQSAMPAVLVETGFINNPKDEAYLNSAEGQSEIVQSIIRAIRKYKASLEEK